MMLTAGQVADWLRVTRDTIYRWALAGRLPGVVRRGKFLRFDEAKLKRWVDRGGEARANGRRR